MLTEAQVAALEQKRDDEEAWRLDRDRPSGLSRRPGHVLREHAEGRRPDLPADVHRHVLEVGRGEAVHRADGDHGCGLA